MVSEQTIYTIGHSTRTLTQLVAMLQAYGIELLADIRSFPGSRRCPQFNKETLESSIPIQGIKYIHLMSLGGRRKTRPDSNNTAWRLDSFRGYADYMETPAFAMGMAALQQLASQKRTAYMCSEAEWWRCHRSMVSDQLKCIGWRVLHILDIGSLQEHPYTKPAKIVNGQLSYHSDESKQTKLF